MTEEEPPLRSSSDGRPAPPSSGTALAPGTSGAAEPEAEPEPEAAAAAEQQNQAQTGSAVGRHPWWTLAISAAVVIVAAVGGGLLWLDHQGKQGGSGGREVIIHVRQGEGTANVTSMLQSKKVVGNSLALEAWLLLHGAPAIGAGTYVFHQNESFASVKSDLEAGPNVFSLVIPAGSSVEQVSNQVAQLPGHDGSAFLALATGGTVLSPWSPPGSARLDGLLGAGNYQVLPGETDTQLLINMIDRFDEMAKSNGLASSPQMVGRSSYEVITVASIVQKEAVISKNMASVARVIYNRLAAGVPLQSVATVRYAEHLEGQPVTQQDERQPSRFNTFVNKGLTPSPIGSPSSAALRAALNPSNGPWRYYVVTAKDGTESFATTAAQDRAIVALAKRRGLL